MLTLSGKGVLLRSRSCLTRVWPKNMTMTPWMRPTWLQALTAA